MCVKKHCFYKPSLKMYLSGFHSFHILGHWLLNWDLDNSWLRATGLSEMQNRGEFSSQETSPGVFTRFAACSCCSVSLGDLSGLQAQPHSVLMNHKSTLCAPGPLCILPRPLGIYSWGAHWPLLTPPHFIAYFPESPSREPQAPLSSKSADISPPSPSALVSASHALCVCQ